MKKKFDSKQFIAQLVQFGERQLEKEKEAADFIELTLRKNGISFYNNSYLVRIPSFTKAELFADNEKIDCVGNSFAGGKIDKSCQVISSLEPSVDWSKTPNINYNPRAQAFSRPDFYFAPALSIKTSDIQKVKNAKTIRGEIEVRPVEHQSRDIMAGNLRNPEIILFAHYDSIGPGAIDNASGVSLLMKLVAEKPELLKKCLVVFAGNEELSYDQPIYWGHGFREFEKRFLNLLEKSQKILIVDGPGNGKTSVINDPKILNLAFPIKNLNYLSEKITVISGDYDKLMSVYHAENDLPEELSEKHLCESYQTIVTLIGD